MLSQVGPASTAGPVGRTVVGRADEVADRLVHRLDEPGEHAHVEVDPPHPRVLLARDQQDLGLQHAGIGDEVAAGLGDDRRGEPGAIDVEVGGDRLAERLDRRRPPCRRCRGTHHRGSARPARRRRSRSSSRTSATCRWRRPRRRGRAVGIPRGSRRRRRARRPRRGGAPGRRGRVDSRTSATAARPLPPRRRGCGTRRSTRGPRPRPCRPRRHSPRRSAAHPADGPPRHRCAA